VNTDYFKKDIMRQQKANDYDSIYGMSDTRLMHFDMKKCEEIRREMKTLTVGYKHRAGIHGMWKDLNSKERDLLLDFTGILTNPNLRSDKTMNLSISRPVMIGGTDILTARNFELESLIREAQSQIENNQDIAKVSESYKLKQVELQEIIDLCAEQLDKHLTKGAGTLEPTE
jgi:hydroxylamine reductase (hybrid-cluster protein)